MYSTFYFPGGGGVQDGGPDLHWHQHPHHSGAWDQPRADSVEETANTCLTLDKSRQCGDLAVRLQHPPLNGVRADSVEEPTNTRLGGPCPLLICVRPQDGHRHPQLTRQSGEQCRNWISTCSGSGDLNPMLGEEACAPLWFKTSVLLSFLDIGSATKSW